MIVSCDCGVVNTYTKPLGFSLESAILHEAIYECERHRHYSQQHYWVNHKNEGNKPHPSSMRNGKQKYSDEVWKPLVSFILPSCILDEHIPELS